MRFFSSYNIENTIRAPNIKILPSVNTGVRKVITILHNIAQPGDRSAPYNRPVCPSQITGYLKTHIILPNQFGASVPNQFAARSRCGLVVKPSLLTRADIGSASP